MKYLKITCQFCQNEYMAITPVCPHCGERGPYPNVLLAQGEAAVLQERYRHAAEEAQARGVAGVFNLVAGEVEKEGRVCLNRSYLEVLNWVEKDGAYANFYKSIQAGIRFPANNEWDRQRELADSRLFPFFKEQICFAALSLQDEGMPYYGACTLVLDSRMIANRATLFEENSVLFCRRHKGGAIDEGFRATWQDRGVLAAVKVAPELMATTSLADLPALLMRPDTSERGEDVFLEVHIYGPLTVKSLRLVTYPGQPANNGEKPLVEVLVVLMDEKGVGHAARP